MFPDFAKATAALQRINAVVSATWDEQAVFQCIVNEAVAFLDAKNASVILFDLEKREAWITTSYGRPTSAQTLRYPLHGTFAGWVVDHQRPLRVARITPEEWPIPWRLGEQLGQPPVNVSVLLVPMWLQDRLLGCLEIVWFPHRAITDQEETVSQLMAAQAAAAIANARLIQEKERALSEAKQTAEALRASEIRYQALAEHTCDLICEVDRDGRFAYLSPNCQEITGYRVQELLQQPFFHFVHPEDLPMVRQRFADRARKATFRARHKSEEWRWVEVTGTDYHAYSGERRGVMIARDITERIQAEEERKQWQDHLSQNQRLQALGRLAGGIAHDFNNLLTPIMGFTELSLADLPADSELYGNLTEVLKASKRAREIVRQILAFSRSQPQERRVLSLGALVAETLPLLRASFPPSIDIRYQSACSSDLVWVDAAQLQQVLMNLCTNAKDAMKEKGGILSLALADAFVGDAFAARHGQLASGAYVKLSVQDNGCGMAGDLAARIFEPFFTTKPAGEGSGLGLSIVHGIVSGHGGSITVESAPEQGTRFDVYLPQAKGAGEKAEVLSSSVPCGKGKVLLVDDDKSTVQLEKNMLEQCGYEVMTATHGEEALRIFRSAPQEFVAVVADQVMPELTGGELAKILLQIRPDLPLVLCTGGRGAISPEHAAQCGIRSYLMKPFTCDELYSAVRRAVEGAEADAAAAVDDSST